MGGFKNLGIAGGFHHDEVMGETLRMLMDAVATIGARAGGYGRGTSEWPQVFDIRKLLILVHHAHYEARLARFGLLAQHVGYFGDAVLVG